MKSAPAVPTATPRRSPSASGGVAGHPYEQGFDLQLRPDRLKTPLGWKKPRTVFVNSMSDLFHPDIPPEYTDRVFRTMTEAAQHTFQILTKRPERAAELADRWAWPPNVWMGVSVENQRWTTRIDTLRTIPAAVRFLSCEPLLAPLDLGHLADIDWVIVGGESGAGARPMDPEWARSLRDQCVAAGIAYFFKQWGEFGSDGVRRGKKTAGRTPRRPTLERYASTRPRSHALRSCGMAVAALTRAERSSLGDVTASTARSAERTYRGSS